MATSFMPLITAFAVDGIEVALLAVAVLGIGLILAKQGSLLVMKFTRFALGYDSSVELVRVGNTGHWERGVYDSAMRDLDAFQRDGGRLDREASDELNKWKWGQHSAEVSSNWDRWDRDVFDSAMNDIDSFREKGGRLDRFSADELNNWKWDKHSNGESF